MFCQTWFQWCKQWGWNFRTEWDTSAQLKTGNLLQVRDSDLSHLCFEGWTVACFFLLHTLVSSAPCRVCCDCSWNNLVNAYRKSFKIEKLNVGSSHIYIYTFVFLGCNRKQHCFQSVMFCVLFLCNFCFPTISSSLKCSVLCSLIYDSQTTFSLLYIVVYCMSERPVLDEA